MLKKIAKVTHSSAERKFKQAKAKAEKKHLRRNPWVLFCE